MTEQMCADFVIVGGGTAGCVLADRLSADGRHKVIMIEAGGVDRNPWLHIPLGYGRVTGDPRFDWCFRTMPQTHLDDRSISVPRGRVLGGSSSTNGLLYVRGQAEDYDAWAADGCTGWSYSEVLPYFRRSEGQQHGENIWHGADGPLGVRDPVDTHEMCDAFVAACGQAGVPPNDDFNGPVQEGAGYYQMTVRGRRRCSTAAAFLREARGRNNLQVITGAVTERIEFDGRRAVGVTYRKGTNRVRVGAAREVIISAGAIASPQLLMLSGVGPAEHLSDHGLPVILDRPVGQGLQDHLNIRSTYRAARAITMNDRLRGWPGKLLSGADYLLRGRGPLTIAAGYAGAFYRADGMRGRPDMQGYFLLFSTDTSGAALERHSGFMTSAYQLRPESRGSLRLASADVADMPLIDPAYLSEDKDRRVTLEGLKRFFAIMQQPAMAPYLTSAEPPLDADDEVILAHIRAKASPGHHFASSCRMGTDAAAIVNSRLMVKGIEGLRVVDASIMPFVVSGNTNAPVVMIAEKGADMILEDAAEAIAA